LSPRAVIGLGNPGVRYERTRHNAGFMVVDRLAAEQHRLLAERRHGALWGELSSDGAGLVAVKPQAFMNRSGVAVAGFVAELGLAPADLLVVHDELDLPLGRVKLKRGGGTAGHRGLESIVAELASRDFARLRVGIGRPPADQDVADFVLRPFAEDELATVEQALGAAARAVVAWATMEVVAAMNLVNAPPRPPDQGPEPPES
jgi:PTH1 family peptidyl-tRNA hydrolase